MCVRRGVCFLIGVIARVYSDGDNDDDARRSCRQFLMTRERENCTLGCAVREGSEIFVW